METEERRAHPWDPLRSGPPVRTPMPLDTYMGMSGDEPIHIRGWDKPVDGRRVIVALTTGYQELIAVGEPFQDDLTEERCLRVALEAPYWHWKLLRANSQPYYPDGRRVGDFPLGSRVFPAWAVYVVP